MSEYIKINPNFPTKEPVRRWYVVYTKPRQEGIAKLNLERQGFETYLPRVALPKRRKSHISSDIQPFFPRYLFVSLSKEADDWSPIRSTRGVCNLVDFGGVPRSISSTLIEALKKNEDSECLQITKTSSWKKGEEIAIDKGVFAGYSCIFEESCSENRVIVMLGLVGKRVRTLLHRADLKIPQIA